MVKHSNESTKKLIKKEEMVLIKNSETAKDTSMYGNLYNALEGYEFLTISDLNKNHLLDSKAKTVILTKKSILIENIIQEWSAFDSSLEADGEVHCQLCNHLNKWVFYIRNKHNNKELNVGSECVKKFPGIENVNHINKKHNILLKKYNEDKRRIEFGELEIDDPDFIANADKKFIGINILLPYNMYMSIYQVINDLRSLRISYIKSGGNLYEIADSYKNLKNQFNDLWNQATLFYNQNRKKKLICNKKMSDWLKVTHLIEWEKVSRNNGLFDEDTLQYAYHSDFISKYFNVFKEHLSDTAIQMIGVNGDLLLFSIQDEYYRIPVYFKIKNKIFMESIGCHCLVTKTYKFSKKNLTNIYLDKNKNTFDALHNRMLNIMQKIGFDIVRGENSDTYYFKRNPKIINYSKWSSRSIKIEVGYKKIQGSHFFEKCTLLLLSSDIDIEQNFNQWYERVIMSKNGWMTQNQKDEWDKLSSEVSYQKAKEFTPY